MSRQPPARASVPSWYCVAMGLAIRVGGAVVHAVEGIRIVREAAPDAFTAAVCHPLGHPDDVSSDDAMERLAEKVSAGVDLLLAQSCFDPETFRSFHRRVREEGIAVPIRPGIMGVQRISQAVRAAERCGVPIEASAFDPAETEESLYPGLVRHHLRQYLAWGLPGAHVFTLNRPCWADAASTKILPEPSDDEAAAARYLQDGRRICVELRGTGKGVSSVPTSAFDKRTVGRMVLTRAGRAVLRVEHPGFLRCALQPLLSMVGGDVSLPLALERELNDFNSVLGGRGDSRWVSYADGLRNAREHPRLRESFPFDVWKVLGDWKRNLLRSRR